MEPFPPDHVARLVIDILDNTSEKREPSLELTNQGARLRKMHVARDQRQQRLMLPETIAHIEVTELPGVVHLIVRGDIEPLDHLLETLDDAVDRLRVYRAGRDVYHLVGLGYVQANQYFAPRPTDRQLDPSSVTELTRRRNQGWDIERFERRGGGQHVCQMLTFLVQLLIIREPRKRAAMALRVMRARVAPRLSTGVVYSQCRRSCLTPLKGWRRRWPASSLQRRLRLALFSVSKRLVFVECNRQFFPSPL